MVVYTGLEGGRDGDGLPTPGHHGERGLHFEQLLREDALTSTSSISLDQRSLNGFKQERAGPGHAVRFSWLL